MSSNNNNDDPQSGTASASIGQDTVVQVPNDEVTKLAFFGKKCCKIMLLICVVILLSFFTSVITTRCLLDSSSNDLVCDNVTNSGVNCRQDHVDVQSDPVSEKQVQERQTKEQRIGAQLSAKQERLKDSPPRLIWTHEGSGDYIDGVNHVTHYHGNHQYDCLETTQAGHYLIFIQLTYQYSDKLPLFMVKSYFTLTRFRNNKPYVVAKSDHVVPPRKQRIGTVTKQPFTMVRSDSLRTGDRLCVMVSNPELIYASKIDNFFGIVAL